MSAKASMKEEEQKEEIHAPGDKEVPLFDMRLRKLEESIFKGEEEETQTVGYIGLNGTSW